MFQVARETYHTDRLGSRGSASRSCSSRADTLSFRPAFWPDSGYELQGAGSSEGKTMKVLFWRVSLFSA